MSPPRDLSPGSSGAVRCPRCKQWSELWPGDGLAAGAFCCDLAFVVQPDGTPEVYDLAEDEEQLEEDCA